MQLESLQNAVQPPGSKDARVVPPVAGRESVSHVGQCAAGSWAAGRRLRVRDAIAAADRNLPRLGVRFLEIELACKSSSAVAAGAGGAGAGGAAASGAHASRRIGPARAAEASSQRTSIVTLAEVLDKHTRVPGFGGRAVGLAASQQRGEGAAVEIIRDWDADEI